MGSAVEFTKVWLHQEIPTKTHPTAREVTSEFTGVVKVIKLRRERTYVWENAERTCVLLTTAVLSCHESVETEGHLYEEIKRTCILVATGEQKG